MLASYEGWTALVIVLPLLGAFLAFVAPGRGSIVTLATVLATFVCIILIGCELTYRGPLRLQLGGWGAPLGIDLAVSGSSVMLLGTNALVVTAGTLYGSAHEPVRRDRLFWPLWLGTYSALNAVFLSADLFNLYVAVELLSLSAVGLVASSGRPALTAGMRYLMVSLIGSTSFLAGIAFSYAVTGALDLESLGSRLALEPAARAALALVAAGMLIKSALFPLHVWLPPAHGAASTPVSALLSAMVVQATYYILMRIWLELPVGFRPEAVAYLLGVLGTAAALWGGLQALVSPRLKTMIAYSTVAQVGYLFLLFPLAQFRATAFVAWAGAFYLLLAHAFAKSALFLAAGNVLELCGHDELARLEGRVQRAPLAFGAIAIGGVSLVGLPPTGGFLGKWMLLNAAIVSGQWWWAVALLVASSLSAAALARPVLLIFRKDDAESSAAASTVPERRGWLPLSLAMIAVLLGLLGHPIEKLLRFEPPVEGETLVEVRR